MALWRTSIGVSPIETKHAGTVQRRPATSGDTHARPYRKNLNAAMFRHRTNVPTRTTSVLDTMPEQRGGNRFVKSKGLERRLLPAYNKPANTL
jgi:hypothetical protein